MTRTATCCCGELSVTTRGEPERVVVCHCEYCQRRSGSDYQVSAWFFGDQITSVSGECGLYVSPENNGIEYRFCRTCGSTVFWHLSFLQAHLEEALYGVSVGCFNDPEFPSPEIEIHTGNRHNWVAAIRGADSFHDFPPLERMIPQEGDPQSWRAEPRRLHHGSASAEVTESEDDALLGYRFQAEILEISHSGLRLSCDRLLADCTLDLWVVLDGKETRLRLSVEVRWASGDPSSGYEAGVEVIDNPLTDIAAWYQRLKELPGIVQG
ncbi:MAG: GFA family protein [Proteobacteria bacterium]|nr:GFA family protein [Pseudomonadota bacterium]